MDLIAHRFAERVRETIKGNLIQIMLFGSRARGDYSGDSDYDFLIVLNDKSEDAREKILDIEVDFLNTHDQLITSLLYDKKSWEQETKLPLGINVLREGVSL